MPVFETLYADPARLKSFLAAMTGVSRGANLAISRHFPWAGYKTFAAIGTAQGDLAVQIATSNGHLRGIGFGRPTRPFHSAAPWLSTMPSSTTAANATLSVSL
jgi:hypothetical protein